MQGCSSMYFSVSSAVDGMIRESKKDYLNLSHIGQICIIILETGHKR